MSPCERQSNVWAETKSGGVYINNTKSIEIAKLRVASQLSAIIECLWLTIQHV